MPELVQQILLILCFARTNDEALQITGLLLKNKMPAKLIQTNDGFSLFNLVEIRFFLSQLNFADDVYIFSEQEILIRFKHNDIAQRAKTNIFMG